MHTLSDISKYIDLAYRFSLPGSRLLLFFFYILHEFNSICIHISKCGMTCDRDCLDCYSCHNLVSGLVYLNLTV